MNPGGDKMNPGGEFLELFYMLVVEGKYNNGPTVSHLNLREAQIEAERLALVNPGKRVYVLMSHSSCIIKSVEWSSR